MMSMTLKSREMCEFWKWGFDWTPRKSACRTGSALESTLQPFSYFLSSLSAQGMKNTFPNGHPHTSLPPGVGGGHSYAGRVFLLASYVIWGGDKTMWTREVLFMCSCCVPVRGLCQRSCGVTTCAEGTKCSWGLQKWLKRPSCWCVCLGAVLHAMKVVLSLFQYRIISLNFGLLINFGDLPQFGWIKGECLSTVYEFLKLSDKRNIIVW